MINLFDIITTQKKDHALIAIQILGIHVHMV
jgi:hypothetical protein